MKQFVGGITNSDNQIQLNLQIAGGAAYSRVYNNNVSIAIDKLLIVNEALSKLPIESHTDTVFYIDQLINLFKSTHIEFLYGSSTYQIIHNAQIIRLYLSHLIKKFNTSDILEALGLTKILTDVEQDVSIGCHQVDTINPYIDELIDDDEENLLIITRQIRNSFTEICAYISSKQSEIQTAYDILVRDLDTILPK